MASGCRLFRNRRRNQRLNVTIVAWLAAWPKWPAMSAMASNRRVAQLSGIGSSAIVAVRYCVAATAEGG